MRKPVWNQVIELIVFYLALNTPLLGLVCLANCVKNGNLAYDNMSGIDNEENVNLHL